MDATIETPLLPESETVSSKPPRFLLPFALAVLGLNLLALAVAWVDRSWFAFGISLAYGPALNACLAISGSVVALRRRRSYLGILARDLVACWCIPATAAALDYFLISAVGLQGC